MRRYTWALLPLAGLMIGLLSGCGGGAGDTIVQPPAEGKGTLKFAFAWPKDMDSRKIPTGTKSIWVTVKNTDGLALDDRQGLANYTAGALTGEIFFDSMAVGTYEVSASAWNNTGGPLPGNSALAAASNPSVAVNPGHNQVTLVLSDQIVELRLNKPNFIKVGSYGTPTVDAFFNGDLSHGYAIANTFCNWSMVKNGGADATISTTGSTTGRITVSSTSPFDDTAAQTVSVDVTATHKTFAVSDTGRIPIRSAAYKL